jgi:hypothetical protein
MKSLLSLVFLLDTGNLHAQFVEDAKVVIISCKSGDLYIDGVKIVALEADDAHQEKISFGEHYLNNIKIILKYKNSKMLLSY